MKGSFRKRVSFGKTLGLSPEDAATLASLTTPEKIQDFVSALDFNRERNGDTCQSVVRTLKNGYAHCIEGAFVAATALWMGGSPPLVMDMQAQGDDDHVITLFRSHGCWGAISKSKHAWLRWRDPIYRTLRELAISYFHGYVNEDRKTLRTYSASFDLRRIPPEQWVTAEECCWDVAETIDGFRHYRLITPHQSRRLRLCDRLEMKADQVREHRI